MERIFLSTATAYLIALILVPIAIRVFKSIDILDSPDDRKLHKTKTPSMGGIPIFVAVFISLPIWVPFSVLGSSKYLLASCIMIFLLGVRDDIIMLRARHKLIGQLIIGLIVIYFADIRFMSLYGVFGVYDLPYWASLVITLFTFIVITNAFNLIDGIDGLAGSIGIFVLGFLGLWFFQFGDEVVSFLCFSTAGAILAFLYFNWEPAKIFMGDTGSMFIGFIIAAITVKFIDTNYYLPVSNVIKIPSHISMAVGLLSLPLFDTIRVFVLRALKGKSPMTPDTNHLHHRLLEMGFSHKASTWVLLLSNISLTGVAFLTQSFGNLLSLFLVFSSALILNLLLLILHKKYRVTIDQKDDSNKKGKQIFLSKSA